MGLTNNTEMCVAIVGLKMEFQKQNSKWLENKNWTTLPESLFPCGNLAVKPVFMLKPRQEMVFN
jgi:hypothetical protein